MLTPIPHPEHNLPLGSSGFHPGESSLRGLICHVGRLMHEKTYIASTSGSISARLDDRHLLMTPPEMAKGFLQPDQLIVVDMDSAEPDKAAVDTETGANLNPPDELPMHLECYRQRPDILGVIQAQPPAAVALTIAGVSMRTCVVPEAIITLGLVPTAAYSTPASPECLDAIRLLIKQHDAILLAYHGSLTVGADVWQAYLKLETLEHTAVILHRAAQLGPIQPLAPEQVAKLLEIRRQFGYWRAGDEERFCEACGAC